MKKTFYCEWAYAVGIVALAFGTALMEKADFGMSMVVAPAYLIHLKISQFFPFFSFGVSEYVFQAVLLGVLSLVMRKAKRAYFLSFATAVVYGTVLDMVMSAVALFPYTGTVWRAAFYLTGLIICAIGVALLFYTYFPPEAYELFVKEFSHKYNIAIAKTKTLYDCCSCILGIVLSLSFFGTFVGVKWGTVLCSMINGWLIGRISLFLDKNYVFKDALPLRNILE